MMIRNGILIFLLSVFFVLPRMSFGDVGIDDDMSAPPSVKNPAALNKIKAVSEPPAADWPVDTAGPKSRTLIVIPARYTIVQIAFDIVGMRSVSLVAYDNRADSPSPVMHVWDADGNEWVQTSINGYRSADIFKVVPQRIILVGSNEDVPAPLLEAPSWCSDVKRIPTLNMKTLVNELDKSLKFTPREWKRLAERHGLKLRDLNAERRRYGRYGKPGLRKNADLPAKALLDSEVLQGAPEDISSEDK